MKLDRKILPFMYLYAKNPQSNTFLLRRSVAQLVERRSPKPKVAGSIPSTPASLVIRKVLKVWLKLIPFSF